MEAHGRPGAYVTRELVMERADISDPEEFRAIAKYLYRKGWINEASADYGVFVVTAEGLDEAVK